MERQSWQPHSNLWVDTATAAYYLFGRSWISLIDSLSQLYFSYSVTYISWQALQHFGWFILSFWTKLHFFDCVNCISLRSCIFLDGHANPLGAQNFCVFLWVCQLYFSYTVTFISWKNNLLGRYNCCILYFLKKMKWIPHLWEPRSFSWLKPIET